MGFDEKQQEKISLRVSNQSINEPSLDPKRVGAYVLGETLDSSNYGTSYKAVDENHRTDVVVKILNLHSAPKPTFEKRLKIELEAAKNLAHPSIVSTLESGRTQDGATYVVTEYIDDPTLFDVLHCTGNLTKTQLLGYLIGACESLAHAHEMGVVHRKISARNIFVSSTTIDGTQIRITGYGTGWIGDSRKADSKIDVAAFGELIEEVFRGNSMPPEVQNIATFCTAAPQDRYNDCGEVLQNLLLANEGKLPNPPKNRTGQQWMKPAVVATIVIVTILITVFAFNFSNESRVAQNSANDIPSGEARSGPPTPIDLSDTRVDDPVHHPTTSMPVQQSPQTPQAPVKLPSASSSSKLLSKEGVGTTAAAAAAVGAAAYKTMSADEKAKARHAALDSAKTAVHKWQALDENSKAQWKSRAAGAAGKAADLWKRLPKN
jgi:serine/threonine protein kinase